MTKKLIRHMLWRFNSLSTRTELMILLLCVIVPFSGLVMYGVADRYWFLQADARHDALNLARGVGDKQNAFVLHTRLLLKALAADPVIQDRNWGRCNSILKDFQDRFGSFYSNIHVADITGKVVCSGIAYRKSEYIGDRKGFQHAIKTRKLVIGDMVVSRITGLKSINARQPVIDKSGQVFAVLSAQISVAQFGQLLSEISLPAKGELLVVSHDKSIVLRRPDSDLWLGTTMPPGPITDAMFSSKEGTLEAAGLDGVSRIYGFTRMGSEESEDLRIAIGLPIETITNSVNRYLTINLALTSAVILLVLLLAWFGVEFVVLRKVRLMVDTVLRFKSGERTARTGIQYGRDELSHIARAIDEMAAELQTAMDVMHEQSIRDPLTRLYNRRFMEESLMRGLAMAKRQGCCLGVIIADLDHFKRFNDTFGHEFGDRVLLKVANAFMANVRAGDIVCRFGGEEFAIIMQDTCEEVAMARAESLRAVIAELTLEHEGWKVDGITSSFGIAIYPNSGEDVQSLLHNADLAMYEAKRGGRNRVVLWGADAPPN